MSIPPARDDRTARPRLVYRVGGNAAGWTVRCETERYGPYVTLHAAMLCAVGEAEAATRAGFDSTVLMQPPTLSLCAGTDARSPGADVAGGRRPPTPVGRSGGRPR
ncbi:MAG TPA: hypothetical protein VFO41_08715 [Alphaproteobacteria bacterium]|nr:hypothetical protein [Alphaproteobacteria bacterium]